MNFDTIIFKNKTFGSLLEDIYNNSKEKEKQLRALISQLKEFIHEPGDAVMMIPLLKEYLEISVKNDDALIKMAGIVQRAINASSNDGSELLTEKEKEMLFQSLQDLNTNE